MQVQNYAVTKLTNFAYLQCRTTYFLFCTHSVVRAYILPVDIDVLPPLATSDWRAHTNNYIATTCGAHTDNLADACRCDPNGECITTFGTVAIFVFSFFDV